MRGTSSGFEREDELACVGVLGGFGVSSDHFRERVADAGGGDERVTENGFVWVNESGGIDGTRSSASD